MTVWLLGRLQFGFQALQIADNHAAAIDLNHSLGLPICDASSWLLTGMVTSNPSGVRLPSFWARRNRKEARRWRTVVDESSSMIPSQPAQTRTHHPQHLKYNLGMSEAQCLKILFTHKQESGIADRSHGGWVVSSIENG